VFKLCVSGMDLFFRGYVSYIQARFFRIGLYTHLYIETSAAEREAETLVSWVFTFQDLGSTHTISNTSRLTMPQDSVAPICVDGVQCVDLYDAEDVMFRGYYADYVCDLYAFEGISF
jgi:hypothetical protein